MMMYTWADKMSKLMFYEPTVCVYSGHIDDVFLPLAARMAEAWSLIADR